jgi:hypothetical protein
MAVLVPRRPYAFGRDRLGILGGQFGAAVPALVDTNTEYRPGTNDFMMEACVRLDTSGSVATFDHIMAATEDTGDWLFLFHRTTDRIRFNIDGLNVYSTAITPSTGNWLHLMLFADRSGSMYFYGRGIAAGSADISAKVAVDLNSDTLEILERQHLTQYDIIDGSMFRVFIFNPTGSPCGDATAMAAIASERFVNPDAESPTLLARANYATERRLDVNFNDNKYNATTVVNEGTGGNLTVGGGLFVSQTMTHVESSERVRPEEDWYTFDTTHEATNAAADVGFVSGGSYICELIVKDVSRIASITDHLMEIDPAGTADHFRYRNGNTSTWVEIQASAFVINSYFRSTLEIPHAADGLVVVHMTVDRAGGRLENIMFNGNKWLYGNNIFGPMDLSGNCLFKFGDASTYDGLLACRVWCSAADMPSDLDDILYRRVYNPWTTPATLAGLTLRANYEMRVSETDGQGAASAAIKNLANPGTGDLAISGGGLLGTTTVLAVKGLT